MRTHWNWVWLAMPLMPLMACGAPKPAESRFADVSIRRTSHGVVHVAADDFEGAGYGVAWAYTMDNRCLLARRIAEVRGRLAEQLGADAPVTVEVHDLTFTALQSDHYFRGWFDRDQIRASFEAGAIEVLQLADGYAAGINAYVEQHPDLPDCPVRFTDPVTRDDVFMIWVAAAAVASGEVLGGYLPHTSPSGSSDGFPEAPLPTSPMPGPGSNAWAIGREGSSFEGSVHLYNPHFPWDGIHRLYMVHVTVADELDVMGATLGGFPLPLAGFTSHVAWGLTFSPAARWFASELVLEDGGHTYAVDGVSHDITKEMLSIPVLGEDQPREIPFFRAQGRPLLHAPEFSFGWTGGRAFAATDTNATNTRIVEQFLRIAQSDDVHAIRDALARIQGVPWSYTVASDAKGDVLFGDISAMPNLSAEDIARCVSTETGEFHLPHGMLVLDGTRGDCVPVGLLDPDAQPYTIRSDYVANSNNNYQVPNVDARIEGFSAVLGGEGKPLSLRASLGLRMIHDRLAGTDGLGAPGFSGELAARVFQQSRNLGAELLVDEIVDDCWATPTGEYEGEIVDLGAVCLALDEWDRSNRVEARGAVVFRGMWRALSQPERLFAVPASLDDPLGTPHGYTDDPEIRQEVRDALARVAMTLETLAIAPDAPWGDTHFVVGPSGPIGVPGGSEFEGVFDAIISSDAYYTYEGWVQSLDGMATPTLYGASYLHVVELGPDGPAARGVLPYSQATESSSPWYLDQLPAWAEGRWFAFPFRESEIASDPELIVEEHGASR